MSPPFFVPKRQKVAYCTFFIFKSFDCMIIFAIFVGEYIKNNIKINTLCQQEEVF